MRETAPHTAHKLILQQAVSRKVGHTVKLERSVLIHICTVGLIFSQKNAAHLCTEKNTFSHVETPLSMGC